MSNGNINPYWDPFRTKRADESYYSGLMGGGEGTGDKKGGLPWDLILSIGLSLISSLFGKSESKRKEEMFQDIFSFIKPEYGRYTGLIKGIDPKISEALLRRLEQTKGWGWPGGG